MTANNRTTDSADSASAASTAALREEPQERVDALLRRARRDIRAARYEQAAVSLTTAIDLDAPDHAAAGRAELYFNLGIAHYRLGNYDAALAAYLNALAIHRTLDDRKLISRSLNGIGNVYYARSDFANALQYYREGMELDEALRDRPSMAVAYNNVGLVHGGLGDMPRAREFLQRSLTIREELKDYDGVAYCLHNLGYSWFLDAEHARARDLVIRAFELRTQQGDRYGIVNSLTLLGRVHLALEDYAAAAEALERALPVARDIKLQRELLDVYEVLSEAYARQHEHKRALEYHKLYHAGSRELFNSQSEERMQQLVVQHKLERAQYEKEMYRMRSEHLEMALHRKNDELATMALLLVQKAELINNFRRQLPRLIGSDATNRLDAAMQELDRNLGLSSEWESFERGLQETQHDFVKHLAARFPDLSPTELRLCTLIKLGLGNKDIAELMNVGLRDIENHRYRMRRKFGLPRRDKLDLYLLEFEKQVRQNEERPTEATPKVQTLSARLPELSQMELKVCSLLLLSMSSKEIADSLALSVRTIERHRLRIRRKLGLARNANLTTYLASLT